VAWACRPAARHAVAVAPSRSAGQKLTRSPFPPVPAKSYEEYRFPSIPFHADGLPHASWPGLAGLLLTTPKPWLQRALLAEY